MQSTLGSFLRQLRLARGMTLRRLAEEAGINDGTISRWESDKYQPRVKELETVLEALQVPSGQQEIVFLLIHAPRARAHLLERGSLKENPQSSKPSEGDMLRTIRRHKRISLKQVADALGVNTSTVSRWECSQIAISQERLNALCDLLEVPPEERRTLALSIW